MLRKALTVETAATLRSQLFVPGNRPERFEKACAAGADLVCIDLEDAVSAREKDKARRETLEWLAKCPHDNVSIRINALDTPYAKDDIKALNSANISLPYIMIPKVNSKADIDRIDEQLGDNIGAFFVIIESAKGLVNAAEIFDCLRVKLGMFGGIDFAADIDSELSWEAHLYARSHLVACAIAKDVALFDSPHFDVRNLDDCEATTRRAKAIGMHARSAIHPAQIKAIHKALRPSEAEIEEAKRVIKAYEDANGNVVLLDGKFIEEPVIKKARRIVGFSPNP